MQKTFACEAIGNEFQNLPKNRQNIELKKVKDFKIFFKCRLNLGEDFGTKVKKMWSRSTR